MSQLRTALFQLKQMRCRLRTLLILLATVPPLVWVGWTKYEAWRMEREQLRARRDWLHEYGVLPPPQALRAASSPAKKAD